MWWAWVLPFIVTPLQLMYWSLWIPPAIFVQPPNKTVLPEYNKIVFVPIERTRSAPVQLGKLYVLQSNVISA
jgi:hypothetical protein